MSKKNLKIVSKKRLFSKLQGEHTSPFSGSGLEFLELREYSIFDNAKHINHKRSATSNTPLVNIYSEQRELNIVVVYLVSGSLEYKTKKEIARDITTTLSYSATKFKERLNLLFFSKKEELFFESIKHNISFDLSFESASSIEHFGKEINYNRLISFLNNHFKEKSLIFLIGDFLDSNINLAPLSFKHELYAILVRDKSEEELKALGEKELKDPITLKVKRLFISKSTANSYNKALQKQDKKLFENFNKYNIKYTKIYNQNTILKQLKRLLDAR